MKTRLAILALATLITSPAMAREQIRAVGSSTVFPFVAAAAEEFGRETPFRTPIVESTGTGGGLKLFCDGLGQHSPDIANASRSIKDSEKERCTSNGVTDVLELKLGYDGIVLANQKGAYLFDLTKEQIFLALARQVQNKEGVLVDNPYRNWSEIAPNLPNIAIEIYGPPPTSGTRDAFVELVMDKACKSFPAFEAAYPDKHEHEQHCRTIREDGVFIEAGENENLMIQKLKYNANALAIFGYSFLEENHDKVQAAKIKGVSPLLTEIISGKYSISRSLYVYIKRQHYEFVSGLEAFVQYLASEEAMDPIDGVMVLKGLIPLTQEEREAQREKLTATEPAEEAAQ